MRILEPHKLAKVTSLHRNAERHAVSHIEEGLVIPWQPRRHAVVHFAEIQVTPPRIAHSHLVTHSAKGQVAPSRSTKPRCRPLARIGRLLTLHTVRDHSLPGN